MPSKPGNPGWPNGSTHRVAVESFTAAVRRLAGQERIDLLGAEEALETDVAARLVRAAASAWPLGAERGACGAVDREADEVGLGLGSRGGPGGRGGGAIASVACGDGLPNTFVMSPVGPVPVFSRTMFAVRDGADVAAGSGERHPRRRGVRRRPA